MLNVVLLSQTQAFISDKDTPSCQQLSKDYDLKQIPTGAFWDQAGPLKIFATPCPAPMTVAIAAGVAGNVLVLQGCMCQAESPGTPGVRMSRQNTSEYPADCQNHPFKMSKVIMLWLLCIRLWYYTQLHTQPL